MLDEKSFTCFWFLQVDKEEHGKRRGEEQK